MSIPVLAKLKVLKDRFLELIEEDDEVTSLENMTKTKAKQFGRLNSMISYAHLLKKECFSNSEEYDTILKFILSARSMLWNKYLFGEQEEVSEMKHYLIH